MNPKAVSNLNSRKARRIRKAREGIMSGTASRAIPPELAKK